MSTAKSGVNLLSKISFNEDSDLLYTTHLSGVTVGKPQDLPLKKASHIIDALQTDGKKNKRRPQ